MHITKKNIIFAMMIAIGSLQISAMESPEWRAEEIRLHELRQQQKNPQQSQLKQPSQTLVNQFEALQSLQQKQQRKRLKPTQLQTLQNLEQQFQNFSPQQLQQLRQQVQNRKQKQQQKKLKKQQKKQKAEQKHLEALHSLQQHQQQSQYQPNLQHNQPRPFDVYAQQPVQSSRLQQQVQQKQTKTQRKKELKKWKQSQAPQNALVTREVAMKQVLLDERDNAMQRLEEHITNSFYHPAQLLEEVERLQIPIDLYLLEPSQELENKTKEMQSNPNILTADQQAEIDRLQQLRLENVHQELILKQIKYQQPQNPFPSTQPQLQQSLNDEQVQLSEGSTCCIEGFGCTENQGVGLIPCKNKHHDLICKACLNQIKNKTNKCPICREQLID